MKPKILISTGKAFEFVLDTNGSPLAFDTETEARTWLSERGADPDSFTFIEDD